MIRNVAKYVSDCNYGNAGEAAIASCLQEHFNTTFSATSRYARMDFISEDGKIRVEVKRRRVSSSAYPTTLIGQDKIDRMGALTEEGVACYCVFMFQDGSFIIKIDEEGLRSVEQNKCGGRSDRDINEVKQNGYAYIDVRALTKMEKAG